MTNSGSHFLTSNDKVQVSDDLVSYETKLIDQNTSQIDLVFNVSLLSIIDRDNDFIGLEEDPEDWFNPSLFDEKTGEYTDAGVGRCSGYSVRHRVTINWIEDEETSETETSETETEIETSDSETETETVESEPVESEPAPVLTSSDQNEKPNKSSQVNMNEKNLPQTGETTQQYLLSMGSALLTMLTYLGWRRFK